MYIFNKKINLIENSNLWVMKNGTTDSMYVCNIIIILPIICTWIGNAVNRTNAAP